MKFLHVTTVEKLDGAPGFAEPEIIDAVINAEHITAFYPIDTDKDDPKITIISLSCGAKVVALVDFSLLCCILDDEEAQGFLDLRSDDEAEDDD